MKKNVYLGLIIVAMLFGGCSSGSDTSSTATSTTPTTHSYVGAGSVWDVTISSNGTFNIDYKVTANDPVTMTISGTQTTLPSGFLELTVGATTGSAPDQPNVGDAVYAFEIPGYTFLLAPLTATDDKIVPMVVSGACPNSFDLNWVATTSPQDPSVAGNEFFGTASYDSVAQTMVSPFPHDLVSFGQAGQATNLSNVTCNSGIIHFPHVINNGLPAGDPYAQGNPDVYYYVSATAGGIVHADFSSVPASRPPGGKDSIFFALPVEVGSPLSTFSGVYSGMVFDDSQTVGNKTSFVKVTCDASGQCIGGEIDPATDADIAGSGVIIHLTASNSPSNGFFTGTIDGYSPVTAAATGTPGNIACALDSNANASGKNVLSCVFQAPDGTGANLANVFLTQR